ncbi:hypothetical protein, partial [Streptomyces zhihengii]
AGRHRDRRYRPGREEARPLSDDTIRLVTIGRMRTAPPDTELPPLGRLTDGARPAGTRAAPHPAHGAPG